MSLLQAILLGILQGITEFLPISSSGHLVLAETVFKLQVADLKDFDVVLHVATLLAILIYFRRDIINPKYWPWLILGSIPAAIAGFTLADQIDTIFRSATAVGIVMIVVGALYMIPEKFAFKDSKMTWPKVLAIGIAQAVALIPGVSRSGSTIFTGKMLGLKREEAARFSFMLGSIAIAGAGLLTAFDLSEISLSISTLSAGFIAAFLSGLAAVSWLMKFLKKHPLYIFGVYLLTLGAITVITSLL
ncbi:undecaprenyl-diphosphate phosphatase [Patescibacteria group bacterium]|nr:undecaprenyl-diphosphate phosphatase [Patescibacteria group bacterium]